MSLPLTLTITTDPIFIPSFAASPTREAASADPTLLPVNKATAALRVLLTEKSATTAIPSATAVPRNTAVPADLVRVVQFNPGDGTYFSPALPLPGFGLKRMWVQPPGQRIKN